MGFTYITPRNKKQLEKHHLTSIEQNPFQHIIQKYCNEGRDVAQLTYCLPSFKPQHQ